MKPRLVQFKAITRIDGLRAAYLTIGRLQLAIGWVPGWYKLYDCWPIAFNRNHSWRYDRKACLSLLWLRIGFQVLPNAES